MTAFNPLNIFMTKPSWRVNIGGQRFLAGACGSDCFAGGMQIGFGYSEQLDAQDRLLGYLLVDVQAYYDVHFLDQPYKLAAGPTAGLLLRFNDSLKWQIEDTYFYQAVRAQREGNQVSTELRYQAIPKWNLGIRYDRLFDNERSQLVGYYFF